MVVLESNVLTSQDHMEKKNGLYIFVSHAVQPPPAGAAGFKNAPKAPQHLHLLEQDEHFNAKMAWQHAAKREESRAALGGRIFNKKYWSWAFQSWGKMNVWLRQPV